MSLLLHVARTYAGPDPLTNHTTVIVRRVVEARRQQATGGAPQMMQPSQFYGTSPQPPTMSEKHRAAEDLDTDKGKRKRGFWARMCCCCC